MVDENEKKTNRNVAVRRGRQVTTSDEGPLLPLVSSQTEQRPAAPTRSGSSVSIIPSMLKFSVRDNHKREHAKTKQRRGFRVEYPTRMLMNVVLVFFVLPLLLFFYREIHLHDERGAHAHFKADHYIHVDTQDVLSHLLDKPANTSTASKISVSSSTTKQAFQTESLASPQLEGEVAAAGENDDLATLEEARKEEPKVFHQNATATATTPDAASSSSSSKAKDQPEEETPEEEIESKEIPVAESSEEELENNQRRKRRLQRLASR